MVCVCVCVYVCMYVYNYVSLYVCMCTYAGLYLGGREGHLPPENRMAPLGYVVCIVTYIILKRFTNHMMNHHNYNKN